MKALHSLGMEAAVLVYIPQKCIFMPEPSSGEHFTLLPLTGNPTISIGVLQSFMAAKLTVASKHVQADMGVQLKLLPCFSPQLNDSVLIDEAAFSWGPIWMNEVLIVHDDNGQPLLVNDETVTREKNVKVANIDQYTPVACAALASVGYTPRYVNDAFSFKETVTQMWQHHEKEKSNAEEKEQHEWEAKCQCQVLAAATVPMYASKDSEIKVALLPDVINVDPEKFRAFIGASSMPDTGVPVLPKEVSREKATIASAAEPAQQPSGSATMKATDTPAASRGNPGEPGPKCNPTTLYEALGLMMNSLEHSEDRYFTCFKETVQATREVLADLNEADSQYVNSMLDATGTWHRTVVLTVADIHTDSAAVWDTKRDLLDQATTTFSQACEKACIKHAEAQEAQQEAIKKGEANDLVITLLDKVLEQTWVAANVVVKEFQKQFNEVLLPRIPCRHLPILVHGAYNTMTQFHMMVWRMVADKCIMPMCHTYLSLFGTAAILQHALEKVPSACMLGIPPHSAEPKDKLSTLLDSLGSTPTSKTPAGRMPTVATSGAQGSSSAQSTGSTDTGSIQLPHTPIFRGKTSTSAPVSKPMSISLFGCGPVTPPPGFPALPPSQGITSTSSAPVVTSMPMGHGACPSLPVSIPVRPTPGGRTGFLTDLIRVSKLSLLSSMAGLGDDDAKVDDKIKQLAGDMGHKHAPQPGKKHPHAPSEEDDSNGDGSTFEDLDAIVDPAAAKKAGKVKSSAKSTSTTDNWTDANLDGVHQDRYSWDLPEMTRYRRNYLSPTDHTMFNLKNHECYLKTIMVCNDITSDVVFTKEEGQKYFQDCGIPIQSYDQGLLKPLP